nr:expressed conserved protein [Hymenolepis microstoma]
MSADSGEEIEVPIEAYQEYITAALKFAPLSLSDKNNLASLVDNVVDKIYSKNYMITNVFNIDDNAVLPEDMPQTTYSRKKHEWIKANIKKHEEQIFLLKSAEERVDEELASIKILQNDLNVASTNVGNAVKRLFGDTTIQDVCSFVEELKQSRRRSDTS